MSDDDAKKPELLTPVVGDKDGGIAIHQDGEHRCLVPFRAAEEGQDATLRPTFAARGDGSFERIVVDGAPQARACSGPAQVATDAYRESWERTFGTRGGVS